MARAMLEASVPTGNPEMLFELARLYIDPDPTLEPDPKRATSLFVEAASRGSIPAMLRLVDMKVATADGGGAIGSNGSPAPTRLAICALLKRAELEGDTERQATVLKGRPQPAALPGEGKDTGCPGDTNHAAIQAGLSRSLRSSDGRANERIQVRNTRLPVFC